MDLIVDDSDLKILSEWREKRNNGGVLLLPVVMNNEIEMMEVNGGV